MEQDSLIPRRFIRIHLGPAPIPEMFDEWWETFKQLHPGYDFMTLRDGSLIPPALQDIFNSCTSYSNQSDVLRYVALQQFGGVYVDTDVMPLRSFDDLLPLGPFAGKRSSKSFEAAVIGSPARHPAVEALLAALPKWYWANYKLTTLPVSAAFLSSIWFNRSDVQHLPSHAFYPYNGFGAPKRADKLKMFAERNFHKDAYCAHFSNHRWGGKPKP